MTVLCVHIQNPQLEKLLCTGWARTYYLWITYRILYVPMGHCFLSVTSRDLPAILAVTGHDFLAASVVTGWDFPAVTFSVWGNVKNSVGGRNRSQY